MGICSVITQLLDERDQDICFNLCICLNFKRRLTQELSDHTKGEIVRVKFVLIIISVSSVIIIANIW